MERRCSLLVLVFLCVNLSLLSNYFIKEMKKRKKKQYKNKNEKK